jgi:transcriptional regulator with XRE-family HTH domain
VTPEEFKNWRKSLSMKQKEAADRLGLKKRMIQYYEKGERNGREVEIPLTVELACFAVSRRVLSFNGTKAKKTKRPV